ncbi:MAG: hypothetical protein MRY83_12915 [Flavobacteriales bacterium]|nr:hypothetical protein [Flavobacteriales bacterium]
MIKFTLLFSLLMHTTLYNAQTLDKAVVFEDWILNLDALQMASDNDPLNIIWDLSKEKSNHSQRAVIELKGKEYEVSVEDKIENETINNYMIQLIDPQSKESLWQYSPKYATAMGRSCKHILIEDRLFVAVYSPISCGSDLVCINVNSGKEIWRGDIKQLLIDHSWYRNMVHLRLIDDKLVMIGDEAGGKYIQIINPNTGENLFTEMKKTR